MVGVAIVQSDLLKNYDCSWILTGRCSSKSRKGACMSMGTASRVYLKVPLGREIPDHSTVNLTRAVYDGSVSVPILILIRRLDQKSQSFRCLAKLFALGCSTTCVKPSARRIPPLRVRPFLWPSSRRLCSLRSNCRRRSARHGCLQTWSVVRLRWSGWTETRSR